MAIQRAKEFVKDNKKVLILTHSRTLPINIRKNILIVKELKIYP